MIGKYFLPAVRDCTTKFLAEALLKGGCKQLLLSKEVDVIHLRQFEELKVSVLLERILNSETMKKYIPDISPTKHLDKTYILAIIQKFDQPWLDSQYSKLMKDRKEKQILEKKGFVEFKDEVRDLFEKTNSFSSEVGRTGTMLSLKIRKRRTKKEMQMDIEKEQSVIKRAEEFTALKRSLEEMASANKQLEQKINEMKGKLKKYIYSNNTHIEEKKKSVEDAKPGQEKKDS